MGGPFRRGDRPHAAQSARARFEVWEGVISALYLPLLAAHALSSSAFVAAVGRGRERWDRVLALALGANAVRALLRILEMHAGVAALVPINRAIYLPITLLAYGSIAVWLARAARRERREIASRGPR